MLPFLIIFFMYLMCFFNGRQRSFVMLLLFLKPPPFFIQFVFVSLFPSPSFPCIDPYMGIQNEFQVAFIYSTICMGVYYGKFTTKWTFLHSLLDIVLRASLSLLILKRSKQIINFCRGLPVFQLGSLVLQQKIFLPTTAVPQRLLASVRPYTCIH